MDRVVSAHQPHLLPWLGYLNKVACSDVFVLLDTVQFLRREYQNRSQVKFLDSVTRVTAPVKSAPRSAKVSEMVLADPKWSVDALKTLRHCYTRTPYFSQIFPGLSEVLGKSDTHLVGVCSRVLRYLLDLLEIRTPVFVASTLDVTEQDPTRRLICLTKHVGGTHYLSGRCGKDYMDLGMFEAEGIVLRWQSRDFLKLSYAQQGSEFVPGLSSVDALFNIGPEATRALVVESGDQ